MSANETWGETRKKIITKCEAQLPEYYRKKRESTESYFLDGNAKKEERLVKISPSNKYILVITPYSTKPGSWNYTRGEVFLTKEYISAAELVENKTFRERLLDLIFNPKKAKPEKIADIKRNYGRFPFAWVEDHPDGHDYLICGEDYQAVSIVQLDTGTTKHIVDPLSTIGAGWCHAGYYPSPNKLLLAASGCGWACPYDVRFYDFRKPMDLLWPIVETVYDEQDIEPWDEKTTIFSIKIQQEVRASDQKPTNQLSDEELEALDSDEDDDYDYIDVDASISQEELMKRLDN